MAEVKASFKRKMSPVGAAPSKILAPRKGADITNEGHERHASSWAEPPGPTEADFGAAASSE